MCINCNSLFQMSIQLPTLRSLRSLLDKMKNLAPSVTICSASNGDLSFIVETDSAMVVSRYYNLMLETTNGDGATRNRDGELEEITCLVDSKQIAMCCASIQVISERNVTTFINRFIVFFFVFQFSNIRMVANLLQDDLFNIHITIRDNVSMHCNIVAVDVDE